MRFRSTVGVMGGRHLLPVSGEVRAGAGAAAGDQVEVELEPDTAPREVEGAKTEATMVDERVVGWPPASPASP